MKIIVCHCTKRKLDQAGIFFNVSNTFKCECSENNHSGYFVVPCGRHTLFKSIFGGD